MKLLVWHLSDIHFQEKNNAVEKKKDKLFDAVKNRLAEVDECLIIISGDIAYSGKEVEYSIAGSFLGDIRSKLEQYSGKEIRTLMVPGNHDCFFDEGKKSMRGLALDKFRKDGFNNLDEGLLEVCCEPQKEYVDFEKKHSVEESLTFDHALLKKYQLRFDGVIINVLGYNTSWFSLKNEIPGAMGFPLKHFENEWEIGNANLVLSVLHHPFNWQEPENARDFKMHIESTSDVVLSGHEHSSTKGLLSNLEGNNTWYVEAPALQETKSPAESAFNILLFDFEDRKLKIEEHQYAEGVYKLKGDSGWKDFLRGQDLKTRKININANFQNELTDLGASFSHPKAEEVNLEDLYAYPNLEDISSERESEQDDDVIAANRVLKIEPGSTLKALVLGEEAAGKTALCRFFYKQFYDEGLVPIMLHGSKVKGISDKQIQKIIESAFKKQYHDNELVYFQQLDREKIVVLIDDFHLFKPKRELKRVFVKNLTKLYPNVIITGNRIMQYEDFTEQGAKSVYEEFKTYSILVCGPELRDELIRKWNGLGNDFYTDKNEIYRKNDRATSFINDIVKKSLIPAYPFFVISMLQGMESAEGQNPEYSIHGYYYQLIINKALAKAVDKTKELGAFHSIITQYCYFLFAEKIRFKGVSRDDFRTFYSDFCKRFEIETISLEKALEVLEKGKLIKVTQDEVRIAYKYVYYYHVAKYLSEKIATVPEIQEKVRQMCERVYREEYSNIVMFLVHLEKSQLILDELLINAKKIFKTYPVIRLEEDTSFINKLVDRIPEEILEHTDEEDARKEDLKEEEKQEQLEREYEEEDVAEGDYDLDEDVSALEIMPRLNRAVKTIEILGQVTKKHWAEIEGPKKLELAEETFLVGLRTLGFYFDLLEKNIEILVDHVKEIVERKHLKDDLNKIELKHITNGYIFRLCSLSSYGIFRRVSNSIGLEDLAPTFKRLEEKLAFKSVQLINLSIKLEHFKSFPEHDLDKFQESNGSNFICINVMQNMIVNYMYLYHTTAKKKQQLCEKFNIAMPKQRKIEATSKVRKTSA